MQISVWYYESEQLQSHLLLAFLRTVNPIKMCMPTCMLTSKLENLSIPHLSNSRTPTEIKLWKPLF